MLKDEEMVEMKEQTAQEQDHLNQEINQLQVLVAEAKKGEKESKAKLIQASHASEQLNKYKDDLQNLDVQLKSLKTQNSELKARIQEKELFISSQAENFKKTIGQMERQALY